MNSNAPDVIELTILIPCLDEAETILQCIKKAESFLKDFKISGEILIADNGSTDGSQELVRKTRAKLIGVRQRGYGSAIQSGIMEASGMYVIMGDADDSYDLYHLDGFLGKLREGYDLVMGNRFLGGIAPGAMPFLHRYIGNPILTAIGRLFFRSNVGDFHCGLRGFRRQAILDLDLRTTGMEFASEMVVKATLFGLKITEVPTTLSPAGRTRPPHLRTWQDGWRHLRFLLLYSPRWLFLYPGMVMMILGIVASLALLPGPIMFAGRTFDIHTLLYSSMGIVVGYQAMLFAIFTKVFAMMEGLLPEDRRLNRLFKYIQLETGLIAGAAFLLAGIGLTIYAYWSWGTKAFGDLDPRSTFRIAIPAVTALILGVQTVLYSFFLSVLGMRRRR